MSWCGVLAESSQRFGTVFRRRQRHDWQDLAENDVCYVCCGDIGGAEADTATNAESETRGAHRRVNAEREPTARRAIEAVREEL